MAELKVLTKELEDVIERRKSLHAKEPDGLGADAVAEESSLHDRAL